MRRRDLVIALASTAAAATGQNTVGRRSRFKQAAMVVNFGANFTLDDACRHAARIGLAGFDLIPYKDWPTLTKHGLIPTMEHDARNTFEDGIIHPEAHPRSELAVHESIDRCAAIGCPNSIVVGGQKRGMPQEEAMSHAVAFLNRVKSHAEQKGVTILLEPVNPVDRPDQLLNRLSVAFDICKRVNSPRVKTLFDIYHAQRTDGDICRNIRDNYQWIGHFHAAGVPGRNEIDDTQELNYRFIAKTITDLGYSGVIAHEWRPSPGRDAVKSLEDAFRIMDI